MNAERTTLGVMVTAMAFAAFSLVPASLAREGEPAARRAIQSASEAVKMPMMAHMEVRAKLKAALEEAKSAAEAQGAKTAVAKIDESLKLLEEDHQAMHQHMTQMMYKMKQRMEAVKAMEQDMQKMEEEMGKFEQTKPMEGKMQEMRQEMQKMHEQMESEVKEGKMKCPMCKKMMAGEPKVVNTACPLTGNKIDPCSVPDDLIREFEGKKIGFCSPICPAAWDKLTDQVKKEKLTGIMAKQPTTRKIEQHMEHHGE